MPDNSTGSWSKGQSSGECGRKYYARAITHQIVLPLESGPVTVELQRIIGNTPSILLHHNKAFDIVLYTLFAAKLNWLPINLYTLVLPHLVG